MTVTLEPVTDDNWRAVADIAPRDDQRAFVAALAARYLLLSMRGGDWTSLAIAADGVVVGHVMWAHDEGSHWIGGMVIDAAHQGRGLGAAALAAAVGYLRAEQGATEIRLSYHPANTAAARLYEAAGFRATGETEDDEIVAALVSP